MQQQLINLSPDLKKLQDEGYQIEVKGGGHLVAHHIPYVNLNKEVKFGVLVCPLTLASPTRTGIPPDHTISFCGELPCDSKGNPLTAIINHSNPTPLTEGIIANHYFSSKPVTGNYPNYYDKIRTYAEILSIHAKEIDNTVTTKPNKINEKGNI